MGRERSTLRCVTLLGIVAALLGPCPQASAHRHTYFPSWESIESTVARSDLIVRGRFIMMTSSWRMLEVTETLKGPNVGPILVVSDPQWMQQAYASNQLLLCLARFRIEGIPIPMAYTNQRWSDCIWDLDHTPDPIGRYPLALGMDLREFTTPSDLLDGMRAAVAAHVEVSTFDTLFHQQYLNVPVDGRLEALGRTWLQSSDVSWREVGVTALQHFKNPPNIRLLQQIAGEDEGMVSFGQSPTCGRWTKCPYSVRPIAYKTLQYWHAETDGLSLNAPDGMYRPIYTAWPMLAGAACAAIGLKYLRRPLRRFGLPRLSLRPATILTIIGGALILLCIRSHWRADELLIHNVGIDYQIATFRSGLQLSHVDGAPIHPHGGEGAFLLTFPLGTDLDAIWSKPFNTQIAPTLSTDAQWCGLSWQGGTCTPIKSRAPTAAVSFGFLRLPLWPPAVLMLLGGSWMLSRTSLRHRHRVRDGLCLSCGYNLTGNVSGVCPECGMAAAAAV